MKTVEERVAQIMHEYAQLPQLNKFNITLEAIDDLGNVEVKLHRGENLMEIMIGAEDDLSFISETFNYSERFTPRSKDIRTDGLKTAHFDELGYLIIEREAKGFPSTVERFKVSKEQREEVTEILKQKLGKLFNK